ncbi:MAG: protein-glutamate O-methyltransferase CheR [Candidatus Marinimicrobia bacterium]|nr:protein-glutamate O-methyltransferase CheR [Candidatus Neomarinimicrobiota bacterium]
MSVSAATSSMNLTPEQFQELRDIIYSKTGIFFGENKVYLLENRLSRRIKELNMESFEDYIAHVKTQTSNSEEFHQIYNAVTINETFFFRYQAQLEAFKGLLAKLIQERSAAGNKQLKIWSAASSTGEELYTIGIILAELLGPRISEWNIDLVGTDLSHRALALANEAVYTKNSFRGAMTESQKQRYFTENQPGRFQVNEDIRSLVKFKYLNLNDSMEIRKFSGIDYVYCRNVMIYFDDDMKKRVLRSIYGVLNHGGFFFLGEAESLHGISSSFTVEHFTGAFAYKKE